MAIVTTIVISLLLCNSIVNAEFKTLFMREESNPNAEDIYGLTSLKNSTLTYKICRSSDKVNVKKCKIFKENLSNENKETKFCDITLNGDVDEKNVDVIAFGSDKAVVRWYDESEEQVYFSRYTIVHFSDCKTKEAKISFHNAEERILGNAYNLGIILERNEHTFDVIFQNSTACGEKVCKTTFDDQGNQVSGPVAWFTPLDKSFVYFYPNPINGAYIVNELVPVEDVFRISLMKPDGIQTLKEFNHTSADESTGYGSIRICYVANKNMSITCDLYDSAGQFKPEISVDLNYKIEDIDVYNMQDGGFLLMISRREGDFEFRFHLMKIDANGKKVGPIQVPDFDCKDMDDKTTKLFENKPGEYCATRVCNKGEKYNILSKCFTIDDLNA